MPKILAGLGGFFDRCVRYHLHRVGLDANLHKFLSLVQGWFGGWKFIFCGVYLPSPTTYLSLDFPTMV